MTVISDFVLTSNVCVRPGAPGQAFYAVLRETEVYSVVYSVRSFADQFKLRLLNLFFFFPLYMVWMIIISCSKFQYHSLTQTILEMTQFKMPCGSHI